MRVLAVATCRMFYDLTLLLRSGRLDCSGGCFDSVIDASDGKIKLNQAVGSGIYVALLRKGQSYFSQRFTIIK